MKIFFLLAAALLISFAGFCGDGTYAVSSIPEALLKNADVVKRMEAMRFEIINSGETVLHEKYAFTILNESGADYAAFHEWYDKLRDIRSIDGSLYDMNGKLVKKLKNKDVQDVSAVSDNNLIDDSRVKAHNFYYNVYPYTVEYEVEIKANNSYAFPSWFSQEFERLAVEKSELTVVCPENYTVRFKAFNYKGNPVTTIEKGKKSITWQVSNLPAILRPYASPVWHEITPTVFLAPSTFEMEGYKGNASTWQDLGKFQIALNEGRDKLPENTCQTIKRLTEGVDNDKEKVKILYKYLQQNTRYVSIQLGIGGMQPFEASFVAEKGYGDCKALSNYMCSLLKAVGIKAYYTWVDGGESKDDKCLMEDFPSDQFNHIIVCVPFPKDTMWLECTNQTIPAGYMGAFTGNRKALLITEEGGKLVATPRYGLAENLQKRTITARVGLDGNLEAKVKTNYTGTQQDYLYGMLNALSKEKVKKILNKGLSLSTYDINDFKYEEKKSTLPEIEEQLDIMVSKYATISGKRLFISPNLLNRNPNGLAGEEERLFDYVFDNEYKDVDSVEIEIPEGYTPEVIPQDVVLKTKYGTYSSSVKTFK